MRRTRWLGVAALLLAVGGGTAGTARADGNPPAAGGAPAAARGDWLAEALALLRVRLEARLETARILDRQGRLEEALAIYRGLDGLFDRGLAEIRSIRASSSEGAPREVPPPVPVPPLAAPPPA